MPDTQGVSLTSDAQDARYFAALATGVFEIPRCTDCGRWHFYPRVCCPHCHSERLEWRAPAGTGTVYSTTTVRKADGDYSVCLVDLDEGPRLMSTIVGTPAVEVRIGQRVRAAVETRDGAPLLVFSVEGAAA